MNKKTLIITSVIFSSTMIISTVLFANLVDCEYISDVDRFLMDRASGDKVDFESWINEQQRREDARDSWVKDVAYEVGVQFAECFDGRLGERP